jgi:hypothetical protein
MHRGQEPGTIPYVAAKAGSSVGHDVRVDLVRSSPGRLPLRPRAANIDVRYKWGVPARRPPAPRVAASFTKGEVNRAGVLLLDLRDRMERDGAERAVSESL